MSGVERRPDECATVANAAVQATARSSAHNAILKRLLYSRAFHCRDGASAPSSTASLRLRPRESRTRCGPDLRLLISDRAIEETLPTVCAAAHRSREQYRSRATLPTQMPLAGRSHS